MRVLRVLPLLLLFRRQLLVQLHHRLGCHLVADQLRKQLIQISILRGAPKEIQIARIHLHVLARAAAAATGQ